jgi:predicted nucleotidyltransferase
MAGRKTTQELNELTQKIIHQLSSNMAIDEVVLFGSYAKGTATDLSDIDIAVVSPELDSSKPLFKNTLDVIRKTGICEPYVQLIAFPSNIYYQENLYSDPEFIAEIKRTGKVLFENPNL